MCFKDHTHMRCVGYKAPILVWHWCVVTLQIWPFMHHINQRILGSFGHFDSWSVSWDLVHLSQTPAERGALRRTRNLQTYAVSLQGNGGPEFPSGAASWKQQPWTENQTYHFHGQFQGTGGSSIYCRTCPGAKWRCVKPTDPRLQHLNVCAEVDHLNGREIVAELGSEKAMRCCHDGIFRVVSRQLVFWIFLLNVFHSFGPRNEESAYHSFCRAFHLLRTHAQRNSLQVQMQLSVQELSFQDRFVTNKFSSTVLQSRKLRFSEELCVCLRHFSGTACAVCFAGLVPCAALRLDAAGGVVGRRRSGLQRVAAQAPRASLWSAKIYHRVESKQK